MWKLYSLLILCCVLGVSSAQSTYILLNKSNFQQQIEKGNTFVSFVRDLNAYEKFVDLYRELSDVSRTQGYKDLFFGVVDCVVETEICLQNEITKNVEFKIFELRSTKVDGVISFIEKLVKEFLNEDEVIKKLDQPGNVCLFFKILKCNHCKDVLKFWPEVEEHFKGREDVHVGTIDCNHHRSVCNRFDVERYPRYYFIVDGKFNERNFGDRTAETYISFCERKIKEVGKK